MNSKTETLISALQILARDIQTNDGVANACLDEAASRLQQLQQLQHKLKQAIELAEAAAKGSPYKQTPHFWARITELKRWTTELKK
jgi:hypothetical protein